MPLTSGIVSILGLLVLATSALASPQVEGRLQTSFGRDSNPLETVREDLPSTESIEPDYFYRLQGESEITFRNTPVARRVGLSVRGFLERYDRLPSEARAQAETRLQLDMRAGSKGGVVRLETGWRARTYPDSTLRDFQRAWGSARARVRLGPKGSLQPRFEIWTQDYDRTNVRDQIGTGVELAYEVTLRKDLTATLGLEVGGIRFDRSSLQVERLDDGNRIYLGPDQRDNHRLVRIGGRYLRRALIQLEYGFRSHRSNSIGSSFHRHEVRWLVSRGLPGGFSGQFYGNLESTHYTDKDLVDVIVIRVGEEEEASDDNNVFALQLGRPLLRGWRVQLRHTWFRNESLLVGDYYQKRVWTLALSWESGGFVGF
ncbi:MAG: hypothetical protein KC729_15595 [Candidatus Eisenbacteria bacterium]|uniref:DUF3570 domain-containing protein n=1 Tax=Eiseniibacteriota bacterium TaxID=2212470 RepID=A0A956M184_UNCEI|nr:hypothetical protein [Candidatus Eisenbacteria bacterium]